MGGIAPNTRADTAAGGGLQSALASSRVGACRCEADAAPHAAPDAAPDTEAHGTHDTEAHDTTSGADAKAP